MIEGSCQCGGVRYQYAGDFGAITVCHCRDCRKAQGTAGVVAAPVSADLLQWKQGRELIREYESSPGKVRAFCGQCGTPLYSRRSDAPRVLRLRMGSIDTPVPDTPQAHIYVRDLPPWATLDEEWPRFPGKEPGRA